MINEKLDNIKNLPDNWDSYGSPKLSEECYQTVLNFIDMVACYSLPEPIIVPISGGGVQVKWQYKDKILEIDFPNIVDADIEYLKIHENGLMKEGIIKNKSEFNTLVSWLNQQKESGEQIIDTKDKAIAIAVSLLGEVFCPFCGGSGAIQISEDEWEQCQWCDEKEWLIKFYEKEVNK